MKGSGMKGLGMNAPLLLLSAVVFSLGGMLLSGCSTTPDETYKKSQMTKALDYPPDLVAPTINERFSIPSPGSTPVSTPMPLPASPPASRQPPASKRGGHSH